MASSAHPTPDPSNSLRCLRVNGRPSRRSVRVVMRDNATPGPSAPHSRGDRPIPRGGAVPPVLQGALRRVVANGT